MLTRTLPAVLLLLVISACGRGDGSQRILIFSAAEDFRHGSTAAGIEAIRAIAQELDIAVDATDTSAAMTESNLERYRAVIFLNTSGDVLDYVQQADFERFIQAGGGFLGIHSAAETERDWDWYGQLLGGYFDEPLSEFPRMSKARLVAVGDPPVRSPIDEEWQPVDEWYTIDAVNPEVRVILRVEHADLPGGAQPAAWYHEYDGGRVFFTSLGHNPQVFDDPNFRSYLKGGLEYVLGDGQELDYADARSQRMPEQNRFVRTVLVDSLSEPTELEVLGGGRIIFTERPGYIKIYDPAWDSVRTIAQIDVHTEFEDGLMGIAKDPAFEENGWIYIYYSPPGEEPFQRLSRFQLQGDSLLMDTEIEVLVVPTQRAECCHTGGSIEFDAAGNLYLSTGDDTNPFQSDGFAPIDERPGRESFDAQRTSANTNDLRGKILRITPQADGSYSIPEGNLFEPDTDSARAEIYVMGNRNPYRISIDQKTGFLYWGEVGPDAGEDDPTRGPRGYDEINQARGPGFFGWPLVIADNKAYADYDFASGRFGESFKDEQPINASPSNTGRRELPSAQSAFIWYPYDASEEFPIVGSGGRTAMAGPVFYVEQFTRAEGTFPNYYDGKLLIYEWMRGWILAVTLTEEGGLERIEPIMPSVRFDNPIDVAFDENGILYVLEYGKGWFKQNPDARLNRVTYNSGNRSPIARLKADPNAGAAPLTVTFSAAESSDDDGDELSFGWNMQDGRSEETEDPVFTHTFERPGVYRPEVTVRDAAGNESTQSIELSVGNAPPEVDVEVTGNRTFYWDGRSFEYQVHVRDDEDGVIESQGVGTDVVYISFDFAKQGIESATLGHQPSTLPAAPGLQLIQESDCEACHSTAARSIGPSFVDVSLRYREEPGSVSYLAAKIIQGGGGVWGEQAMSAHPQLSEQEAELMVEYILSLAATRADVERLPLTGRFATREHESDERQGTYIIQAQYTDRGGGGVGPATGRDVLVLRNLQVEAERFDHARRVDVRRGDDDNPAYVSNVYDESHIAFQQIDLTDIEAIEYRIATAPLHSSGGRIEVRLNGPGGPLVSTATIPGVEQRITEAELTSDDRRADTAESPSGTATVEPDTGDTASDSGRGAPSGGPPPFGVQEIRADVVPSTGTHDLYFVFRNERGVTPEALFLLDWIRFLPSATTLARTETTSTSGME